MCVLFLLAFLTFNIGGTLAGTIQVVDCSDSNKAYIQGNLITITPDKGEDECLSKEQCTFNAGVTQTINFTACTNNQNTGVAESIPLHIAAGVPRIPLLPDLYFPLYPNKNMCFTRENVANICPLQLDSCGQHRIVVDDNYFAQIVDLDLLNFNINIIAKAWLTINNQTDATPALCIKFPCRYNVPL